MSQHRNHDLFIPDNTPETEALARSTHLAIGAHQDDLEIMAYHGIAACYQTDEQWFIGVTVTDGSSSSRIGPYADFTNEEMIARRAQEQRDAAKIGQYAAQFQLGYPSSSIKDPENRTAVEEIKKILIATQPETLYLHNPADKHDTHVAVLAKCLQALRELPSNQRPKKIYGCEVWRDLDWVPDARKIALDVDYHPELAKELLKIFDSQISGGKRYDLATLGRRCANATFSEPRASDASQAITFALDLSPLLASDSLSLDEFTLQLIDEFHSETRKRIQRFSR